MRAKKQAVRMVSDYADLILRLSYTYLGSSADAEDVCQEVLLKLLGRSEGFEGPEHERAWVVHGSDGLDELTTTGPTLVGEWKDGKVTLFEVRPEDCGLKRATAADLKGGDASVNAAALRALLGGAQGAYRDIVLLNAAAALVVAGKAAELGQGVALAAESIDSGKALATLDRMVAITNREV